MNGKIWDVVIVGGGPAGLAAGIYAKRAGLDTVILEKAVAGGQLAEAIAVENYPGFPEPIPGPELGERMRRQFTNLGGEFRRSEARGLRREGDHWAVETDSGEISARAVIIATGGIPKELPVKGAREFRGRGVCYCATCDGFFFRGKTVLMVGAGDTALEEALYLADICEKVYVAVRHPEDDPHAIRAEAVLRERAFSHPKIEFLWNVVVEEVRGDGVVREVVLRDLGTGELRPFPVDGVFVKIGYRPATDWLRGVVELDERGYIKTDVWMRTSQPGVFAAGDVRKPVGRYAQAVISAAEGAIAALRAHEYILDTKSGRGVN
jgi:thioredoxin reductase (NADPH)